MPMIVNNALHLEFFQMLLVEQSIHCRDDTGGESVTDTEVNVTSVNDAPVITTALILLLKRKILSM